MKYDGVHKRLLTCNPKLEYLFQPSGKPVNDADNNFGLSPTKGARSGMSADAAAGGAGGKGTSAAVLGS